MDSRTATIDEFYGMVRDRSGIELDKREFYSLINITNKKTDSIIKRDGVRKFASQTDAGGTKVNGLGTYIDDAGTELYIKISQNGNAYKSTGSGSWTQITASAPTFANADCFFSQLSSIDTGAAASDSGTLEASDSTTITDNDKTFTVNAHTGRILQTANGEKKLIAANNATKIYARERFDELPSGAYSIYPRAIEFFVANGTDFYKCDGTTFTRLDNAVFAYAFTGIVSHGERLFGWKNTRLHFSDEGIGEHFSRNNWQDFATTIKVAQPLKKILLIYEKRKVTAQFGDSPDNYAWEEILSSVGTVAPKSVSSYTHIQFFLSDEYGACIISSERLAPGAKLEPLSVSDNYINTHLLDHTAAQLAAACGFVHKGRYYLCVDDDWYVLHIEESLTAPRDKDGNVQWIWTMYDYPDAIDANCLGHYGVALVGGAQDNGQVYELEVSGVTTDDSTAITQTIEKRNWQVGGKETKTFLSLKVSQPIPASAISMAYRFAADSVTFPGSADTTIALASAASFEHDVKIPSSLSSRRDIGQNFSFQITESGSNASTAIEEIVLLYEKNSLV